MSVLVTIKSYGDVATFRQSLTDRASDYESFGESARAAGAIHHRFGVGDGFVIVVDEWDTPEHFEAFFGNPELQAFIGEIGGDPSRAPEITVTEAVASPDEF